MDDARYLGAVTTNERPGYQKVLQFVSTQQVGIIVAVEISRLARGDISWQVMFRHCQFLNVLLADEKHVYDPMDPHDRMMLGFLATFAGFELNVLRERMEAAWKQKAERGDLYCGCPPGYILEDNTRLVKTPDQRVRHAVELILQQFPSQPSAGALCRWCCRHNVQMPVCRDSYGRKIDWREPDSSALIRWLRNPIYAGVYAMGRTKTTETLLPDGQISKRKVALPMDQWAVVIRDHHPPYISWEQFNRNYNRLQRKTPDKGPGNRTVANGQALLPGMLRCRRCGYNLYVRYTRKGALRYICLSGNKQRQGTTKTCLSFLGRDLDELIGTHVLEVVRPAGVEAALRAAEELSVSLEKQRQVLADQVEQNRYEAERARRQCGRETVRGSPPRRNPPRRITTNGDQLQFILNLNADCSLPQIRYNERHFKVMVGTYPAS